MDLIKKITGNLSIIIGLVCLVNAFECFIILDINIVQYILSYTVMGSLLIFIGVFVKNIRGD